MTRQFKDQPQNMSPTERVVFGGLGVGLMYLGIRGFYRRGQSPLGEKGFGLLSVVGSVFLIGALGGKSPFDAALGIRRTKEGGIHVQEGVTIGVDADRLYQFWRRYENLPQFMSHLKSVTQQDARRSHWVAGAPAGLDVSWDAETTEDVPGKRIAWKSVEGSTIPNSGSVEFKPAPGDRGTEVRVELEYAPPGGTLGAGAARLFGEEPSQQVEDDLRRLKRLMEVGFLPTTEGQSSGRKTPLGKATAKLIDDAGGSA